MRWNWFNKFYIIIDIFYFFCRSLSLGCIGTCFKNPNWSYFCSNFFVFSLITLLALSKNFFGNKMSLKSFFWQVLAYFFLSLISTISCTIRLSPWLTYCKMSFIFYLSSSFMLILLNKASSIKISSVTSASSMSIFQKVNQLQYQIILNKNRAFFG